MSWAPHPLPVRPLTHRVHLFLLTTWWRRRCWPHPTDQDTVTQCSAHPLSARGSVASGDLRGALEQLNHSIWLVAGTLVLWATLPPTPTPHCTQFLQQACPCPSSPPAWHAQPTTPHILKSFSSSNSQHEPVSGNPHSLSLCLALSFALSQEIWGTSLVVQ